MATIELDIIKQRSDKLMPSEKIELVNYLIASLPPDEEGLSPELIEFARNRRGQTPTDEPLS
jgi:hypothetical protein